MLSLIFLPHSAIPTHPMAESNSHPDIKQLQDQMEKHSISMNQLFHQYMESFETRFEKLRTQLCPQNTILQPITIPPPPPAPDLPPPDPHPPPADLQHHLRSIHLDIPKFYGSDPENCIFLVEEFFDFHYTPAELRLKIISFHLEGRASVWYQWMKSNNLLTTWSVFLTNVKLRLGPSLYDDPQGALSKLSQTSTVTEFQSQFEHLMNRVTGISETLLISFFIAGLRSDIKREMLFTKLSTLMEAFSLASAFEARADEACTLVRSRPR